MNRVLALLLAAMAGGADPIVLYPTLSEYRIAMPAGVLAGRTVFRATNAGELTHTLRVERDGVAQEFATPLAPGDNRDLVVELVPGTYAVYCPLADHRERGMSRTLTVRARGSSS